MINDRKFRSCQGLAANPSQFPLFTSCLEGPEEATLFLGTSAFAPVSKTLVLVQDILIFEFPRNPCAGSPVSGNTLLLGSSVNTASSRSYAGGGFARTGAMGKTEERSSLIRASASTPFGALPPTLDQ